ncbi:MAG TPA: hypothetical protein VHQ86_05010 [Candidatus Saccharimonadia bacterium]|jgi:hypothetical protein|nr:hypothetical protein [Candidatus Saccharimonadia bacterium]
MLEKQAHVFRERLLAAEKTAKTVAFKKAADGLLPGWDGKQLA